MKVPRIESLLPIRGPLGRGLERLYRIGLAHDRRRQLRRPPHRLAVPVLSVGNLSVGGTGKTPVVEALARTWLRRGGNPGILSRGYRGDASGNDEGRLLARRLPGVPHVQERERREGGERLLREHPEVDLILLDDGFQHRRLARDVDLVLLDATRPFGGGHCLPAGWLREPWTSLERADAILITRCEQVEEMQLVQLERFLSEWFPAVWRGRAFQVPDDLRTPEGRTRPPAAMRVGAFCALGHPEAFYSTVRSVGLEIAFTRSFRDHAHYRAADLLRLRREARDHEVEALITTEKDGVKLEPLAGFADGAPPVFQLRIRSEFPTDGILDLLSAPHPPRSGALE